MTKGTNGTWIHGLSGLGDGPSLVPIPVVVIQHALTHLRASQLAQNAPAPIPDPGPSDGRWGPRTRVALLAWFEASGLPSDEMRVQAGEAATEILVSVRAATWLNDLAGQYDRWQRDVQRADAAISEMDREDRGQTVIGPELDQYINRGGSTDSSRWWLWVLIGVGAIGAGGLAYWYFTRRGGGRRRRRFRGIEGSVAELDDGDEEFADE